MYNRAIAAEVPEFISDPAGYLSSRSYLQVVPYSRQNLTVALQRGGGQVFEIVGDVSSIKQWTEGWRTFIGLDLTTANGEVVRLQMPGDVKPLSVRDGDVARVLARLTTASQEYAYLEVIGVVTELDLIAYGVGLKDRSQVGTIGWVNGFSPRLENYGQPYLPSTGQGAGTAPARSVGEAALESYKGLIASYNSSLTAQELELFARGLLTYSRAYGLQPALAAALFACESGFRPKAVSRAGAQGLGQLMPGTAAGLGVVDAFDPLQNMEASLRLLRGHLLRFTQLEPAQQLALALACYNAGSGAVDRYSGVPPYSETRNYITKVSSLFSQLYQQGYR